MKTNVRKQNLSKVALKGLVYNLVPLLILKFGECKAKLEIVKDEKFQKEYFFNKSKIYFFPKIKEDIKLFNYKLRGYLKFFRSNQ